MSNNRIRSSHRGNWRNIAISLTIWVLSANACYQQFIAQNVKGVCYSRMQATLYLFLGRLLGRMKQYRAALHYFQLTADLNPKSEVAHCWIGWAYSQLSDYTAALASFERAIQIAPSCAYAHAQMGRSFVQLNRHQEAVDEVARRDFRRQLNDRCKSAH